MDYNTPNTHASTLPFTGSNVLLYVSVAVAIFVVAIIIHAIASWDS